MKATYRVLMASAFLVPAFLVSSCDDKNSNPVAPSDGPTVSDVEAPSFTSVGFGAKSHDPHIKGAKLRAYTFDAGDVDGCESTDQLLQAKVFSSGDIAELNTDRDDNAADVVAAVSSPEDNCIAAAYPVEQKIKGKKLTDVKEVDFSYAGGDDQASPTMRIPIDACLEVGAGAVSTATAVLPCGTIGSQFTDGVIDDYAYIEADNCPDADGNVGVVNAEDTPNYCGVEYNNFTYDSWALFVEDNPDARVARKLENGNDARTEVFLSPLFSGGDAHYLIWKIDVR